MILGLGIWARTWEYRTLTSGLNQDEASTGVEALSLYRYGVDRNGISFPMRLIAFGSGQDALYTYLLIPVIALAGLTPTAVRLPMLFFGILSLPLIYDVGRRLRGPDLGLLAMFLLAISPWHIAISRRAGDTNLFPFLFLLGIACMLRARATNRWFLVSCFILGVSLYAYWVSYLVVPVFLLIAIPALFASSRISIKDLVAGVLIFAALAAPAALYMFINAFNFPSVHLGLFTIPRLPSISRVYTDVALLQPEPLPALLNNALGFAYLIVAQSDGPAGSTSTGYPFGFLYLVTFPLILAGGVLFFRQTQDALARRIVLAWLVAATVLGLVISPLFLHDNVLLLALILMCAAALEWLLNLNKTVLMLTLGCFIIAFGWFSAYYHSAAYRERARQEYYAGLLPALDYARRSTAGPICVSNAKVVQPEIFVLFSEKMDPSVGPNKVVYADPGAQFRIARSVGRYFFSDENCPAGRTATYVLSIRERPPIGAEAFVISVFDDFKVLVPK